MTKFRRTIVHVFVLFVWGISPASALNTEDLFSLSLQELSRVKVTIASRIEESPIDASSSVTVVTHQEIKQLGVRTLTELMNYVPGFQSFMSPHESNRSMILARGLSDIYGRNILLMIDGRRINDEYTGGFTFANHLLSLYNAKQVEFIRGPGAAMYGSNALSGVINIITEKREEAVVTLGSNQAAGFSASGFTQAGAIEISGAFDFYRDEGQSYSGLTDKTGFNKSTQDPLEVFQGRVNFDYKRSRMIVEYMNTQLQDYYVFRRINNGINQNDTERLGVYFEQDFENVQSWNGKARMGFLQYKRNEQGLLNSIDNTDWQQNTREAQIDLNRLTQAGHQLSAGAYLAGMDIPVARDNFSNRFVLDKFRRTVGLYFQDQFYVADKLRLTAGVRYDSYSDFGDSVNPHLSLLYRWHKNDAFKFMYGSAYRAPSLGDLYDIESSISGGNLLLKPVTVDSYEVAYVHSQGGNNLTVTWFYNEYQDFIAPRDDDIFDNLYDNQTQGIEFDIRWQLAKHWSSRIGLTNIFYSHTQTQTAGSFSQPETLSPDTYGNLQLNYQENKWNWNINTVAHNGVSVLQDQSSVVVVNSKLMYRLSQQWELSVNLRNLLDADYATPQNQVLGQNAQGNDVQQMPNRGREFFLSLRYSGDM